MTAEATVTQEKIERIIATEHLSVLESQEKRGRYFYESNDFLIEKPFIGIDKTLYPEHRSGAFATKDELIAWFRSAADTSSPAEEEAFKEIEHRQGGYPGGPVEQIDPPKFDGRSEGDGTMSTEPIAPEGEPEDAYASMTLEALTAGLAEAERVFKEQVTAAREVEAAYKTKLNDFNIANSDLLAQKKTAEKFAGDAESNMSGLLVAWSKRTGDKKYDDYLSTIESVIYDIDMAAATDWAREHYKAAINEVVNEKLLKDHIEKSGQSFPFVQIRTVIKPRISRKF